MGDITNKFELLEPPSPDALIPDSSLDPWVIVSSVSAVLLVIALIVFFLIRKKKDAAVSLPEIRNVAHQVALTALNAIASGDPREVAVHCSLIIRKYLSSAANDPSLYETHEEYLSRHKALVKFTDEARSAANQGFNRLATLKYAKEIPTADITAVISESRALLETLHHGFQA